MPVMVLENDRPENMLLSYQRMFGRSTTMAAGGAGTRASVRLVNNRLDTLCTIVLCTAQVAFQLSVERGAIGAVPFGTNVPGAPRDTRIQPAGTAITTSSSALVVQDNTLGATAISIHRAAANAIVEIPFVIGPGDIFVLEAATDASALTNWSIQWRERRLNPSERI